MTNQLSLFCLVNGKTTLNAFPVSAQATITFGELKELIKAKKPVEFKDVDADKLCLWRVSIPVNTSTRHSAIFLNSLDSKEELLPTDELSEIFTETPPKKTIHIIVQCTFLELGKSSITNRYQLR
ncbi:hypothetical protein BGZ98_006615 [Dissophora globulifera]|nr:hypothetical protein BGZ98_006615 [Dissophora globulifera]